MNIETNKQTVLTALRHWGTEPMFELLADSATFTNFVDPTASDAMAHLATPLTSKNEIVAAFARASEIFPEGLTRTIRWVTAEDDRVVVEDSAYGPSTVRPDREFRMRTVKVFHLDAGKIVRMNQTLDSWYCEDYSAEAIAYIYRSIALASS